ncbi:saccharopine dehydrogenase NADP-binding domain-containing protein [Sinorhizobium terangae]|uniref:saccharopine dehydrogenase NADP-binding domain-containing protein n=1 Tax=Sinorhizobium terangae TaxID=110322 RepID=UPI0024B0762E|nr:saccharopine dehydrogenase NADP-binding domain-containing protein [Sinorhizobium terangae]WFU50283.1 saccharopine dehydrogenase NADP-binding domain-containing protein [Sinorhizobium terangae]
MTENVMITAGTVAVFGATGHTGRFVVAELLRRGLRPIAIARSAEAFAAANFREPEVLCRPATVDDEGSLMRVLAGAEAVINCAGPFLDTADALAAAAVKSGIHYIDVSAEQPSVGTTLENFDESARQAGVAVIPGMGFYGGFADLLVTATLRGWTSADTIDIFIGLDSWHPTRGTRVTGERNKATRMVVSEGRLSPLALPPAQKHWEFGSGLGSQIVSEMPFSEIVLISRHVKTTELHTYLSAVALSDIRDKATPAPNAADPTGRSAQQFVVEVVARREGASRRTVARGQDIYAFTAPLVCEVVERLLGRQFSHAGAHAPGEILNAEEVLTALQPDHLAFEIAAR